MTSLQDYDNKSYNGVRCWKVVVTDFHVIQA